MDPTPGEVPLETGPYEGRGVVQHDAGSRSRGSTLAPWRPLLDQAGLMTQGGLCPLPGHDWP